MNSLLKFVAAVASCLVSLSAGAQSWVPVSGGFNGTVSELFADTVNDMLIITGQFGLYNGENAGGFVTYNGTEIEVDAYGCAYDCTLPGFGTAGPVSMAWFGDTLFMPGALEIASETTVNNIENTIGLVKFDGNTWYPVVEGETNNLVQVVRTIDDTLYICGYNTTSIAGISGFGGIKHDGNSWESFEVPIGGSGSSFHELVKFQNRLFIGGNFNVGSSDESDIMQLIDGTWSPVGDGLADASWSGLYAMQVYHNELYVSGTFQRPAGNAGEGIMKWNGEAWSDIGSGIADGEVDCMLVWNDELYIGGHFDEVGDVPAHNIAKWDGHKWCAIPNDFTSVYVRNMAVFRDTLYTFADTDECNNCVFKWNGTVDTCSIDFNSVEETLLQKYISLYPNPASGSLNLSTTQSQFKSVTILDFTGRQLQFEQTDKWQMELSIKHLSSGCYLCNVQLANGQTITKKFIKI